MDSNCESEGVPVELLNGSVQWRPWDWERCRRRCVPVHQLLAIADGVDPHTVFAEPGWGVAHVNGLRWDNRPDNLEMRRVGKQPNPYATFHIDNNGYSKWLAKVPGEPKTKTVSVHQLTAIADGADPHKVFSDGEYHIHHKNGVPWDNRPENLELKNGGDHSAYHYRLGEIGSKKPKIDG